MAYQLESHDEAYRLERQGHIPGYDVQDEILSLSCLEDKKELHILDAGCGSGIFSRTLKRLFPLVTVEGCDASDIRLKQAKDLDLMESGRSRIEYFHSHLEEIQRPDQSFDVIICRFVFEYLKSPLSVVQEFSRLLRPGGHLYLIDLDGLMFNFYTNNSVLNSSLETLQQNLDIDLFVGRKLATYMTEAGLLQIKRNIIAMNFEGEGLALERKNYEERFHFARESLKEALGTYEKVDLFTEAYLSEMGNTKNTLFCNKFIVEGRKGQI